MRFGTRKGTTDEAAAGEEVREALRELRGRGAHVRVAETPDEARQHLAAHVIHPGFFAGSASSLAAEYLRDVLRIDPVEQVTMWALYTEAAAKVLYRFDTVPVPMLQGTMTAVA